MTQVTDDARRSRLFWASCMALIATSVAFGVITASMTDFINQYGLSETQAGWIGGASLGGFAIAIIALGVVIEKIGISISIKMAFMCHIFGVMLMTFADGFSQLFMGASIIALGNGCVEAGCNPLVATLYPEDKTVRLNKFHIFWPLGIIVGALFGFWVTQSAAAVPAGEVWTIFGLTAMQAKLAFVLVPTLIYGYLFLGQEIPVTERVSANVSDEEVKESVASPLFLTMLICMGLTATLELAPGRWIETLMGPAMVDANLMSNGGVLVLVYGAALMAILRYFAGDFMKRFSPTGVLFGSVVLGGAGLFAMTYASSAFSIIATATVFYAGVCFLWPTMIGFIAERVPKSGALGLCLMGGVGMLVVGYIAVPGVGALTQHYTAAAIEAGQGEVAASAYGGKMAFRWIAALAIPLALVFHNLNQRYGSRVAVNSNESVAV
ncbi:MAG: hypothetical protein CBC13_06995 [Planctomycetia bacterium TMED53]|nr:MAG: hypothetical protein CBC13_06995 [Planctomycetia bacterium TMED53]